MKKSFLIFTMMFMCLVSFTGLVNAQDQENGKIEIDTASEYCFIINDQKMTLDQFIGVILKQNLDLVSKQYDYAITDSDLKKFKSKYATYINGEVGYSTSSFDENMQAVNNGVESSKTVSATASIMQMFSTGTTVTAGTSYNNTVKDMGSADIEYYQPVIFVSVQQELLKNMFGRNDRSTSKILENVSETKKLYVEYEMTGLVLQSLIDYWTLALNQNSLLNDERKLRESRNLRNIIAQNVKLGLAENYDLNLYNSLVASSESAVAQSRKQYNDSIRLVLRRLNFDSNAKLSDVQIVAQKYDAESEEILLNKAFENRVDYLNAKLSVENAKLEAGIYGNENMPSLKAELNANSLGMNDEMGQAYSDSFAMKNPTVEVKLTASYPLGGSADKINKRDADYSYEKSLKQMEKVEREVRDDIKSKLENIETSYFLYTKAKESRAQSEIYYSRLVANLRRGRLTAAAVKQGLDSLIDSRQRELQALVSYNISILQLDIATNILFKKYNISVTDYFPSEK
ncbi:MAG: TolC family protein [Spirochaetes bacterium]|nr:TolC family protein [Spirochaetota bacterium]